MTYKIVSCRYKRPGPVGSTCTDLTEFVSMCNSTLEEGFSPVGGPFILEFMINQAFIKERVPVEGKLYDDNIPIGKSVEQLREMAFGYKRGSKYVGGGDEDYYLSVPCIDKNLDKKALEMVSPNPGFDQILEQAIGELGATFVDVKSEPRVKRKYTKRIKNTEMA